MRIANLLYRSQASESAAVYRLIQFQYDRIIRDSNDYVASLSLLFEVKNVIVDRKIPKNAVNGFTETNPITFVLR